MWQCKTLQRCTRTNPTRSTSSSNMLAEDLMEECWEVVSTKRVNAGLQVCVIFCGQDTFSQPTRRSDRPCETRIAVLTQAGRWVERLAGSAAYSPIAIWDYILLFETWEKLIWKACPVCFQVVVITGSVTNFKFCLYGMNLRDCRILFYQTWWVGWLLTQ